MDINNRELAAILWLVCFILYYIFFSKKKFEILQSAMGLFRAVFLTKIAVILLLFVSYVSLLVYVLWIIGFWNALLLKETLIWALAAFCFLTSTDSAISYREKFKDIIIRSITISVIIEYFINIYSFSLTIELITVPILTFCVIVQVMAEKDEKSRQALIFANKILIVYGLIVSIYSIYSTYYGFQDINLYLEGKKFIAPFVLSFLYLPFPYMLFLFIIHENVRLVVGFKNSDKNITNQVTLALFKKFGINLFKLEKWRKSAQLHIIQSKEDIHSVIR